MSDRPVATDALATLGTIISPAEKRDAIHIAVENVVAKEKLYPGQDVGAEGSTAAPVGIVDPFLKTPVFPGQRFWLLIYPRKVNSLRHVWSHPAFPDEVAPESGADAVSESLKASSERWLRDFIDRADCPGYDTTIAAAIEAARSGEEYVYFSGQDAHGHIPSEFWTHLEIVTGERFTYRPEGFSCSC